MANKGGSVFTWHTIPYQKSVSRRSLTAQPMYLNASCYLRICNDTGVLAPSFRHNHFFLNAVGIIRPLFHAELRIRDVYPGTKFFPSRIKKISDPGSLIRIRIKEKELRYFNPQNCFQALGNKVPDPGVKKALDPGSRSWIRNTGHMGVAICSLFKAAGVNRYKSSTVPFRILCLWAPLRHWRLEMFSTPGLHRWLINTWAVLRGSI